MTANRKENLASSAMSLMFVVGYLQRLLRREARHEKIGWTALMILKDLDLLGPSSQRDLAEVEQVRAPTMTVLINQMERKGWVQRRADPDDGRSYKVTITPRGKKQLRATGRLLQRKLETELDALAIRDTGVLAVSLAELARALWKGAQRP
jgi:DNA-binding MarR family transcriptional regulator